ncbi:MAG: hypothetical protein CMK64_05065 [Pseudoalteromonas sp.]|nr:hypothetical protein [Pseudoalteromonas sp.]|tara:strand:- start:23255 stop:23749 length:495 start_codon:yes stop_codon:yes gene_type:complete
MQEAKKQQLKDLILPEDVKIAFDSFSQCEKNLKNIAPYKDKAMSIAFNKVKPRYAPFYSRGHHLSDLDINVGDLITDISELIHADDAEQDKFFEIYLEEIYKLSPYKVEKGVCPYAKFDQLYRTASSKLMDLLQPISGINPSKLDYTSTQSYLHFLSTIFNEQY